MTYVIARERSDRGNLTGWGVMYPTRFLTYVRNDTLRMCLWNDMEGKLWI